MNSKNKAWFFIVLGALIVSLSINIYQNSQNNTLEMRIENFIPAAMKMEEENSRLQQKVNAQNKDLRKLTLYIDSTGSSRKLTETVPATNALPLPNQTDIASPLPDPTRTFKDLNKEDH